MPRRLRFASGGFVYHVLNRAVARARIFDKSMDYAAFERVLKQADAFVPMRLLAYCILSNHWHLVLWPFHDGDLSEYLRWLTVTHTQRWHAGKKRGRESFPFSARPSTRRCQRGSNCVSGYEHTC